MKSDYDSLEYLKRMRNRNKWLFRIRPNVLASPLYKLLSPYDRRVIVDVEDIHFLCDPMSYIAGEILTRGTYEAQTLAMLRRYLSTGKTFFDIGANEGFIAAVGAKIVGATGTVVAVEPQTEVFRVLQMNLQMNAGCNITAFHKALADADGETVTINLTPYINSGGSSIVRKAMLSRREKVETISFRKLVQATGVNRIDLMKIDVEGYEKEIVDSIIHSQMTGVIGALAVDYHQSILKDRKIDPRTIEDRLLAAGFKRAESEGEFCGYTVYTQSL